MRKGLLPATSSWPTKTEQTESFGKSKNFQFFYPRSISVRSLEVSSLSDCLMVSALEPGSSGSGSLTLTVLLSTQGLKWVPVSSMAGVTLRLARILSSLHVLQKPEIRTGLIDHLARMKTLPLLKGTLLVEQISLVNLSSL